MTDICSIKAKNLVTFRTGKLDSNAALEGGIYPFFTCAQETYRIDSHAFDTECVLLAGNNAAGVFPLKYFRGKFNAYQRTYIIEPIDRGELETRYVFYALKPLLRSLESQATGATTKFLTLKILKNLPIPVIPVRSQRKLCAILGSIDDLIENNRQRIALLEKMAEEIYREWFVRLRFPGHEHTPVHKGVPEGWERKSGDELFDTVKGRSYSGSDISDLPTSEDNERPFITLKSLNRGGGYRRDGLKYYRGRYSDDQIVASGDVIMAVTDMTQNRAVVGQPARVPALSECENAAISLDLVCLRPKQWSKTFLYAFCRYSGFASHLAQFANGANVLHLKPSVIGKQKLLSPSQDLVERFDRKTTALLDLIDILDEQAGELAKTRDLLLNRLISGKLRVDDLDIQIPPSMQEAKAA